MEPTADPRVALARLIEARDDGRLDAVLRSHGISLLVVFGSTVDGQAPPHDLDLAIDHDGRLDVLALAEQLYGMTGYERVDLLDLRRAGLVARGEALGHGRPLVEHPPGRFAEAQVTALAMMWDTRWMRDIELAQLAT